MKIILLSATMLVTISVFAQEQPAVGTKKHSITGYCSEYLNNPQEQHYRF
jgi:hypothetical protein